MIAQALCPVLIGRDDELAELEDALLAARRRDGQLFVLTGGAGLGKTRLATEARRVALKLGFAVMSGGCTEADLALPYLPFVEAVGNYLSFADIPEVRRRLGAAAQQLAQIFPQLAGGHVTSDGGDPSQAKVRLFESFMALLQFLAADSGLFLVVEDIHWADASTRELLDYVVRRLSGVRAVLLVTYRSDELHRRHPLLPTLQGWQRARLAHSVELRSLDPPAVASMVRAIFDEEEVDVEFRDFLHARSDGNPFVLEELLKSALDRGDIFHTPTGGWDRKPIKDLQIPRTVSDSILRRVERLGDAEADILRCAAVLGRTFDYAALVAVSGKLEEHVETAVAGAIQEQLIEDDPESPGRYRFRHALTREAVYEDLPRPKRLRLHSAAAETLGAQLNVPPIEIAHHVLAAGRGEEAVPLCIEAGRQAMRARAYREAVDVWERALSHIADDQERGRLMCEIGEAFLLLDQPAAAIEYLEPGIALLERYERTAEAARHRLSLGRAHWGEGRSSEARMHYDAARQVLEPLGPSESLAGAYVRLGVLATLDFDWPRARTLCQTAIAVADAAGAPAQRIWAYGFLGTALLGMGDVDGGFALHDRSWKEALELDLNDIAANSLFNTIGERGFHVRAREGMELLTTMRALPPNRFTGGCDWLEALLLWMLGDLRRARDAAYAVRARGVELANTQEKLWGELVLCWVNTERGLLEEARTFLAPIDWSLPNDDLFPWTYAHLTLDLAGANDEAAVAVARRVATMRDEAIGDRAQFDCVIEALARAGDIALCGELADFVHTHGNPPHHPWHRRAIARGRLAQGRLDDALTLARSSHDQFADAGYRVEGARSQILVGDVLVAMGDGDSAAREYEAALAVARSCDAGQRVGEAVTRLEKLGRSVPAVPESEASESTSDAPQDTAERVVSVMFADVRGYTAMTAASAPVEMAERIAALQRWARREIEKRHGLVDKFAGDAVMATFNAAGARLDHATLAVQAALSLIDKAALMDLPMGVGLASGAAVVGRLTRGANVSVLGDTTNLASRLQGRAAAGEVLLSAEAYRRVRGWLDEQALLVEERTLDLKGVDQPVPAYAVLVTTLLASAAP